ncbi:MAG TPA: tail fiber protein [Solirubrobacteraceae bacterium]|nr:tail fiber protein [Solirubrobacteraceae bacterium]
MAEPYVGEIRMFGGNFAPLGWMFCEGQVLSISDYDVLFNLIGTTYGGDGQTTFALPDLRGRVPVHQGQLGGGSYVLGASGGSETVTLTTTQIPGHDHAVRATPNAGTQAGPGGGLLASGVNMYSPSAPDVAMASGAVHPAGGNQPHTNFQPYLCVAFIISLSGVYPSQS